MSKPPPLPGKRGLSLGTLALSVFGSVVFVTVIGLMLLGKLKIFTIESDSMKPAFRRGDRVYMEGLTYLSRPPQVGEVVVYHVPPAEGEPAGMFMTHRVAGVPGDTLRIADGQLYRNGQPSHLSNWAGDITYVHGQSSRFLSSSSDTFTVPEGHYFVLGDNSASSFDSRYSDAIPIGEIIGRVVGRR